MAKLKTEEIFIREDGDHGNENLALRFKIDINVAMDGSFTTTIPEDIAKTLIDAGIDLSTNHRRNGRMGFFEAGSLRELIAAVTEKAKNYVSRKLIEEKIIIQYVVQTTCSYMKENGQFIPNGGMRKARDDNYKWLGGTVESTVQYPAAYGFNIWTNPCYKRTFQYASGKTKVFYERLERGMDDKPMLEWLNGIVAGEQPRQTRDKSEIDYTEDTAEFFVNMYKAIFAINEKVKGMVTPEAIKKLVDNKQKLLS